MAREPINRPKGDEDASGFCIKGGFIIGSEFAYRFTITLPGNVTIRAGAETEGSRREWVDAIRPFITSKSGSSSPASIRTSIIQGVSVGIPKTPGLSSPNPIGSLAAPPTPPQSVSLPALPAAGNNAGASPLPAPGSMANKPRRFTSLNSTPLALKALSQDAFLSVAPSPPSGEVTLLCAELDDNALWAHGSNPAVAEAVTSALHVGQDILKRLLFKCGGYEVKSKPNFLCGAFATSVQAVVFGVASQRALLRAKWPEELLNLQEAKLEKDAAGQVLFAGLRFRMAVHRGNYPQLTSQPGMAVDYSGPALEGTMAMMRCVNPAQLVCSELVVAELNEAQSELKSAMPAPIDVSAACSALDGFSSSALEGVSGPTEITIDTPVFAALSHVSVVNLGSAEFLGMESALSVAQVNAPGLAGRSFPPLQLKSELQAPKP